MEIVEIVILSISLAMDAFTVSICKGLQIKKFNAMKTLIIAGYFGLFQGIMPILGYLFGGIFSDYIIKYDYWIVFVLLTFLGANMIKETLFNSEKNIDDDLSFKTMLLLSLATSIDALAVGLSFAFLDTGILFASFMIAINTFIICIIGVIIGGKFGNKNSGKAPIIGGIILIFMGLKILLEHLGIL